MLDHHVFKFNELLRLKNYRVGNLTTKYFELDYTTVYGQYVVNKLEFYTDQILRSSMLK
jgi:hypothetical protein